jgi:putative transposase
MPGPIKGQCTYLYMILDLYRRKIVGWEIWAEESAEHASELIRRAVISESLVLRSEPLVLRSEPLVLHSDNGSPMKGATFLETLHRLGIVRSRGRPRVSDDNPYVESLFKTCKYRPEYPEKGFATIGEARNWVMWFVQWYNGEHRHGGLNYVTPNQRHEGTCGEIFALRTRVYEEARKKRSSRWARGVTRNWRLADTVWLNPDRSNSNVRKECEKEGSDVSTSAN